jgi:pyrroline-5-carboxylate reductase
MTLGFVGAGNMTEAMIRGLRGAGVDGSSILATTRRRVDRLEYLRDTWGIVPIRDKAELSAAASTLILAMKPQDADEAMTELRPHITSRHLLITVMAGVPCASVEQYLNGTPVVRAMPNLPMAVLAASTALAYGRNAAPDHRAAARSLFDLLGHTVEVSEEAMNAVTAVAGSGPAYVYLFMEALIEAGIQGGLPPDVAKQMAVQTVYGAAKLVKETESDPADLRRRVTSPGGTTMAALTVLEAREFKLSIGDAVKQATKRAGELAARR